MKAWYNLVAKEEATVQGSLRITRSEASTNTGSYRGENIASVKDEHNLRAAWQQYGLEKESNAEPQG